MNELEILKDLNEGTRQMVITMIEGEKIPLTLEDGQLRKTIKEFHDQCVLFEKGEVDPEMIKKRFNEMKNCFFASRIIKSKIDTLNDAIKALK